ASGKKLELMVLSSLYHIEITPSDVGIHDRIVVQEVIKQMAQAQQINSESQKPFKVVILMEADNLTRDAQHALRRTMEKYAGTCKIILCCNSVSKVIEPLRSRCMVVRIAAPTEVDMKACLNLIAIQENLELSDQFLSAVYDRSAGNLRRAIMLLEATVAQNGQKLINTRVVEPDWQVYLRETAAQILRQQSAESLVKVRSRVYECLSRCIPTSVIFEELLDALLPHCDAAIRKSVIDAAAHFEHTSRLGSKDIYHLDAFIATFMSIYKDFLSTGKH
uniref:Replication factor C subunit 3 n=1 Tax=Panagrolaimus sp. JU765 TaxID=591449 RepID=A0AC34RKU6_9BILA